MSNNNSVVAAAENNNRGDNNDPYAHVIDRYLNFLDYLECNTPAKFKREEVAEFKKIYSNEMSEHPTLFCKMFSGNKTLFEEAKREIELMEYESLQEHPSNNSGAK